MFQSPKTLGGWNKTERFEKLLNFIGSYKYGFWKRKEHYCSKISKQGNMIEMEDNEAENQVCILIIYRTYFHSIIENKYNDFKFLKVNIFNK